MCTSSGQKLTLLYNVISLSLPSSHPRSLGIVFHIFNNIFQLLQYHQTYDNAVHGYIDSRFKNFICMTQIEAIFVNVTPEKTQTHK